MYGSRFMQSQHADIIHSCLHSNNNILIAFGSIRSISKSQLILILQRTIDTTIIDSINILRLKNIKYIGHL
jgi:hypothetical protein